MIKNPRLYNAEAPKTFLASEKLASTKKQGSLSPVKIRGRISAPSPVKGKRIRSSSINK